jgi:hypothetical protein
VLDMLTAVGYRYGISNIFNADLVYGYLSKIPLILNIFHNVYI